MVTHTQHPSEKGVNPVTFQVVKASLSGIVQEMQNALFRTGYSTIIRESQDASCAMMNADGDVVGVTALELETGDIHILGKEAVVMRYAEMIQNRLDHIHMRNEDGLREIRG